MTLPEQTQKILDLLKFALDRSDVDESTFHIGVYTDRLKLNDTLCLLLDDDSIWHVLFVERGLTSNASTHEDLRDAVCDFFWRLARKDTPWDFRAEWEASSGQNL